MLNRLKEGLVLRQNIALTAVFTIGAVAVASLTIGAVAVEGLADGAIHGVEATSDEPLSCSTDDEPLSGGGGGGGDDGGC